MKDSCLGVAVCFLVTLMVGFFSCCAIPAARPQTQVIVISDRAEHSLVLRLIKSTVKVQRPDGGSGTGIVLFSSKSKQDNKFHTFVTTCAHVAQGIPVLFCEQYKYVNNHEISSTTSYKAKLLKCDGPNDDSDLALMEIVTEENSFPETTQLISDEGYEALQVADPMMAIGCGGGRPPYVTYGSISHFGIRGYLHCTSPIFGGNSGGGAFTLDGRLIGMADRTMAIHDTPAPGMPPVTIPVTHAACFTPAPVITKWLKDAGYSFLVDPTVSYESFLKTKAKEFK